MQLKLLRDELTEYLDEVFPQVSDFCEIEAVTPFEATVRMQTDDSHGRPGGTVSGPTMFTLADLGMYAAILAMIGREALAVTTNASIDFMRKPISGRDLIGVARINKLGKTLAVGQVLIYSEGSDEPVAQASMTYSIPPAK